MVQKQTPKIIVLPISLIPLVSKMIEKVKLDKNDMIYRYQSGFRKFFSTDSCVLLIPVCLNNTRSRGTTSVCFSVVINDEHREPEFKIKRRGYI